MGTTARQIQEWQAAQARPCSKCGKIKPFSEFYKSKRGSLRIHAKCKECHNKMIKGSPLYNNKQRAKAYRTQMRQKAIEKLGGRCNNCGLIDDRVLQIDHIKPLNGEFRPDHIKVFKLAIAGDTNLQLLCANCHVIKTWR